MNGDKLPVTVLWSRVQVLWQRANTMIRVYIYDRPISDVLSSHCCLTLSVEFATFWNQLVLMSTCGSGFYYHLIEASLVVVIEKL